MPAAMSEMFPIFEDWIQKSQSISNQLFFISKGIENLLANDDTDGAALLGCAEMLSELAKTSESLKDEIEQGRYQAFLNYNHGFVDGFSRAQNAQ